MQLTTSVCVFSHREMKKAASNDNLKRINDSVASLRMQKHHADTELAFLERTESSAEKTIVAEANLVSDSGDEDGSSDSGDNDETKQKKKEKKRNPLKAIKNAGMKVLKGLGKKKTTTK
jgi:hypothetical protein